jgi:GTP-binding protein Era
MNNENHQEKSGIIAIVGAPNAGKSSLTNALLGQKLSIVSPKVQTTRNSLKAIVIEDSSQIILIDTPGIFIPREDKILERIIVKSAWQALREADHICFLIDVLVGINPENIRILNDLKKENLPITIILNKIDLIKKSKLLEIINFFKDEGFLDIIPVSSLTQDGIKELKKFLANQCKNLGWIYPKDDITDAPMRFIASEITREKLFLNLHKELPYSIAVKTDKYEVLNNNSIKIHQTIYVLRESQKVIIVGKNAEMLKKIGTESRADIKNIVGADVHLYLFVKVKDNWMRDLENFEKIDIEKIPNIKNIKSLNQQNIKSPKQPKNNL